MSTAGAWRTTVSQGRRQCLRIRNDIGDIYWLTVMRYMLSQHYRCPALQVLLLVRNPPRHDTIVAK